MDVRMFLASAALMALTSLPMASNPSSTDKVEDSPVVSVDLDSVASPYTAEVEKAIDSLEGKVASHDKQIAELVKRVEALEKPKVAVSEKPKVAEPVVSKPMVMTSYGIPLAEGEILVAIDGVPVNQPVRSAVRNVVKQATSVVTYPAAQVQSNVSSSCVQLPNGQWVCPNRR